MATSPERRAYQRDWELRNREKRLAQHRDWDREHRPDRTDYAREWWARLKETDPVRHAAYIERSNRSKAVAGYPSRLHYMRLLLRQVNSSISKRRANGKKQDH